MKIGLSLILAVLIIGCSSETSNQEKEKTVHTEVHKELKTEAVKKTEATKKADKTTNICKNSTSSREKNRWSKALFKMYFLSWNKR